MEDAAFAHQLFDDGEDLVDVTVKPALHTLLLEELSAYCRIALQLLPLVGFLVNLECQRQISQVDIRPQKTEQFVLFLNRLNCCN